MASYYDTYLFDGNAALKATHDRYVPRGSGSLSAGRRRSTETAAFQRPTQGRLTRAQGLAVLMAAFVLVVVVALAGFVVQTGHDAAVRDRIASAPTQAVRVHQGDTLWSLAEEYSIDGVSTRELVTWVEQANGLDSSALRPGQTLLIPMVGP